MQQYNHRVAITVIMDLKDHFVFQLQGALVILIL